VKKPTPLPRASHVNAGTSVPREELAWPATSGPVLRLRRVRLEQDLRPDVTALGGLVLPLAVLRRLRAAELLDESVRVLKMHMPYLESDHIIAQALMLYGGGTCIEDMAMLQQDSALQRMLGAVRTPDPTTAGDFLRRFVPNGKLEALTSALDELQERAWKGPRWRRHKAPMKKKPLAVVYLDGHTKELYGAKKAGADFSYQGAWSYSILVATLDDGEWLDSQVRPGNCRSSHDAAEMVQRLLPRLERHYQSIMVVADSDFDRADLRHACEARGAYFAFVARESVDRPAVAAACRNWTPFRTRASRRKRELRRSVNFTPRRKRLERRRRCARARGYDDIQLVRQEVDEAEGHDGTRLVIRRQLLDVESGKPGQREIWHRYRYRYVITNLPSSWSIEEVIDATYKRCDQENVISELGAGIAAWRMPVGDLRGNAAWLEIARLAWNLRVWTCRLALPDEVGRWEWRRFRRAFVNIAVQVLTTARQLRVRILGTHQHAKLLLIAHARLQV
jgi:hypothetical protein